eukprot:365481-Chlamydomonas_euryale.AAC.2
MSISVHAHAKALWDIRAVHVQERALFGALSRAANSEGRWRRRGGRPDARAAVGAPTCAGRPAAVVPCRRRPLCRRATRRHLGARLPQPTCCAAAAAARGADVGSQTEGRQRRRQQARGILTPAHSAPGCPPGLLQELPQLRSWPVCTGGAVPWKPT